ncbi:MAG TPA: mechanosensitive ion channel family protein [Candidatus Acidoferrales bacterium]|nr:mechanosensitive ion channel family protein [Candidatus Acidoferrales bacterium]
MTEFFGIEIPMNPWVVLTLIFVAALILAFVVNLVILRIVARLLTGAREDFDSRLYRMIERYLFPLLIIGLLIVIVNNVPLPPKILRAAHSVLVFCGLLIAIFLLARAVLMILRNAESRYEPLRNIRGPIEILVKIVFVAVGGMIILDNLGVSLTPILTTLGIGSLAVAIALQDTLGNFFAGLYIKADRFIEVGQFVRIETGEEGYVDHIGWRSTRIRMLPNNTVIVPNSKLVQSIITNYDMPDRELAVLVQVGVHYSSDLEKVERVTSQVAKEIMQTVPGAVPSFEPFIRYHTFGDSSINFTVILRAREFVDNFLIKHEFIKRLQARYHQEGIVIPFPIRTVYMEPTGKGSENGGPRTEDRDGRR